MNDSFEMIEKEDLHFKKAMSLEGLEDFKLFHVLWEEDRMEIMWMGQWCILRGLVRRLGVQ